MFSIEDDEVIKEAIFLDTSGGIRIDAVQSALKAFALSLSRRYISDFELHLVSFDMSMYNQLIIKPNNIADMLTYSIMLGGGTDIHCCWDYMRTNKIKKCLILTDGLFDYGTDPGDLDIHFLFHSQPTGIYLFSPYGKSSNYKP
jgi:predicted metal-dependent peptidase